LLIAVAGWMNQEQQQVVDYLREENRVLPAQILSRLRLDDNQRCRLAVPAKAFGMPRFAAPCYDRDVGNPVALAS